MSNTTEELDRLIKHLREYPQGHSEIIGGWKHEFRSDHCLSADYLELLRSELPHWQPTTEQKGE